MTDPEVRRTAALEGRYQIVRELGAGGLATVCLAEDLKHHRPVAIKVLRPELASAIGPERFRRETEIAALEFAPAVSQVRERQRRLTAEGR